MRQTFNSPEVKGLLSALPVLPTRKLLCLMCQFPNYDSSVKRSDVIGNPLEWLLSEYNVIQVPYATLHCIL